MKILLIEDRAEDAELAKLALEHTGFAGTLDWIDDGEKANQYLFGFDDDHNDLMLILLDINLPKVNGLDILKNIKNSSLKRIPVIMLTTSDHESDMSEAYANNANSYIKKPVSFTEFEKTFQSVYKYWVDLNISPMF